MGDGNCVAFHQHFSLPFEHYRGDSYDQGSFLRVAPPITNKRIAETPNHQSRLRHSLHRLRCVRVVQSLLY